MMNDRNREGVGVTNLVIYKPEIARLNVYLMLTKRSRYEKRGLDMRTSDLD